MHQSSSAAPAHAEDVEQAGAPRASASVSARSSTRSAPTYTRAMAKRWRTRSTTGTKCGDVGGDFARPFFRAPRPPVADDYHRQQRFRRGPAVILAAAGAAEASARMRSSVRLVVFMDTESRRASRSRR